MRLINVDTWQLHEFSGSGSAPPYAILSHTWGEEEVDYQDLKDLEQAQWKAGFEKIRYTCHQAKAHGLGYAWIDTCCIDKSSSQELSEAINSMYRWYTNSTVCYVYLSDVSGSCPPLSDGYLVPPQLYYIHQFEDSRWFTRGWTLQELIAPQRVLFYGCRWNAVGCLSTLLRRVANITGIQEDVLNHTRPLADLSIAQRLSWAANRNTSRSEDQAYCLLGIFDVSMPLVYGEGLRAFSRLQEMLIQQSTDQSIFAWDAPLGFIKSGEVLSAPTPRCFAKCGKLRLPRESASQPAFGLSNRGLEITLPIVRQRLDQDPSHPYVTLGILDCKYDDSPNLLALVMSQHRFNIQPGSRSIEVYVSGFEEAVGATSQFARLLSVDPAILAKARPRPLTITRDLRIQPSMRTPYEHETSSFPVWCMADEPNSIPSIRKFYPEHCWFDSAKTMKLRAPRDSYGAIVVDADQSKSVLITFGLHGGESCPPSFCPPASARRIYSMVLIDRECPLQPHLRFSLERSLRDGGDRASLRLNPSYRILAQLCGGALTVSIEPRQGKNQVLASSPYVSSPPSSPTTSMRRPSSSSSSSRRRDSFFDSRSERSNSSYDEEEGVQRTSYCTHCSNVMARQQAQSKKVEERDAKQKRLAHNQKLRSRVQQGGMAISLGSMLVDGLSYLG